MKMHRNRRGLALLLSTLMAFTMTPSPVFANEQVEILLEPGFGTISEQSVSDTDTAPQTDALPNKGLENANEPGDDQADPAQAADTQADTQPSEPQQNVPTALEADSQPDAGEQGVNSLSDTSAQQETTPCLTSLEFAQDAEGTYSGENLVPVPITPAFDKNVTEYNVEVEDQKIKLYQKYTIDDPSIQVYVVHPWLGGFDSELMSADKFSSLPSVAGSLFYYKYQLKKDNTIIKEYTIHRSLKATLKDLDAGETMRPSFDPSVKEYTAAVDTQDTTFTFTPTGYGYEKKIYTIMAGGVTVQSGQPLTITLKWDADGQMRVPITVSGEGLSESKYVLNLRRADEGNVPFIMADPNSGQEYLDTVKKEDTVPLKVMAKANGNLTYQWYESDTASNQGGRKVEGATEAAYYPQFELHESTKDHYFYCEVTNTNASGVYAARTTAAKVTVIPDPTPYDIQIVYEDGSAVPQEGVTVTQGEEAPVFKALFKSRAEGGIEDAEVYYYYYLKAKNGSGTIDEGYDDTYSLVNCNAQGYLHCEVCLVIDGVDYIRSSEDSGSLGIPCTVYGTEAAPPYVGISTSKELQYFVGTEKLDSFLGLIRKQDKASGVTTTWQWMVSEDEGKTFNSADGEGASGVSKEEKPNKSFSIQYTPEGSDKALTRYYKCRVTNTLKSYNGQTYATYEDSPVITVSFKTLDNILDEGQSGWKGSGTEADPYQIVSANDLELLRQVVNEKGYPMKGVVFSMTQDITLPEDWIPIGSLKPGASGTGMGKNLNPFSGIFDGGGYTLTVPQDGLPLLGYVRYARVRNMNLYGEKIASSGLVHKNCIDYGPTGDYGNYVADGQPLTIEIDNVTIKEGTKTLGAGFTEYGGSGANIINIKNCTAEPGVIIGYDKQQNWIGTFCRSLSGTIQNCTSAATVYGVNVVGGLAGTKKEAMGPCRVINCSFTGTVEATGRKVGGIIATGYSASSAPNTPCVTVKNCYVTGNITGTTAVGGIFGSEEGCEECWENGAGYIQNNHFYGKVTATAEDGIAGAIVGYMRSLNRYNVVTNNYFLDTCGAAKTIGKLDMIDTTMPIDRGDAQYIKSEEFARSDDPLGKDADLLGKAQSAADFKNGTVTAALNAGAGSFGNWEQGTDYPVLSKEAAVWEDELQLSGYKTEYTTLDEFTSEGIQATVTMSDGTTKDVPVEEISFSGYVKGQGGYQTVTATYKGCRYSFRVLVSASTNQDYANRVSKLIAAIGEVTLDSQAAIEAARAAYEELTSGQKTLVTNLDTLTAAEQKLAELQNPPTGTPIPTGTPTPTGTSAPTGTPTPTGTPAPTGTPSGIQTPQTTVSPQPSPSITPEPTKEPTGTPAPTGTPGADITPGPTEEPPKTTVIENPDGSKTEITENTVKNEDGSVAQITETKNTDADGTLTGSTIEAAISTGSEGKETSAQLNVAKDADGTVTSAQASISNATASSAQKALIRGSIVKQITQIAGTADVEVIIQNGKANTVVANAADLTAGKKLNIVARKADGNYVLVNAKTYTVAKNGDLFVTVKGAGTYELITGSRMNTLSKKILQTVKAKNAKKTIKKSKTAKMALKKTLNMENVKSIKYSVSKKSVASVTKKGVIKAKKAGTAVVKAKVTLKNGKTKTVKMKVKVK